MEPASETPAGVPEAGNTAASDLPYLSADRSLLAVVLDNLEAFAVAIVMALVIKHYCVEAFKIPTSSMEPTLLGDDEPSGRSGDRILVDKFAYLFSDPERWDVIVFRYPLDQSRNFIKRVVALPGELLRIHRGDIWIKPHGSDAPFRKARKNRRVRHQLYKPFYPHPVLPDAPIDLRDTWRVDGAEDAWRLEAQDRFEFVGGEQAAVVAIPPINRNTERSNWDRDATSPRVRDVRIQARVTVAPATVGAEANRSSTFTMRWTPDSEWEVRVVLAAQEDASAVRLLRNGSVLKEARLDAVLRPKANHHIDLEYVDGDLICHLDGEEVAVLADDRPIDARRPVGARQDLRFEAEGLPMTVTEIALARDTFYLNEWENSIWGHEGLAVPTEPEGAYVCLGDNTSNSSDSRKWFVGERRLLDGTELRYDRASNASGIKNVKDADGNYVPGRQYVIDVQGVRREWSVDEEDGPQRRGDARPFVWRSLIIGRAFVIFWPVTPEFPGRLRFLH